MSRIEADALSSLSRLATRATVCWREHDSSVVLTTGRDCSLLLLAAFGLLYNHAVQWSADGSC